MAYPHKVHRRRGRRRGQKGRFVGALLPLMAALAPTVAGALISQIGKGRIEARRRKKYRNIP